MPKWRRVNVEQLLRRHARWIAKHYTQLLLTKDLLKKESVMLDGKYYMLYYSKSSGKPKVSMSDQMIIVHAGDWQSGFKALFNFIEDRTESMVTPMLQAKAERLDLKIGTIKFRKMKRWGSCNSKSEITINSYTSMLPQVAVEYIVSHEVAHMKELNHSKKFWKVVSELHPDYKSTKKELDGYSVPRLNRLQMSMINLE